MRQLQRAKRHLLLVWVHRENPKQMLQRNTRVIWWETPVFNFDLKVAWEKQQVDAQDQSAFPTVHEGTVAWMGRQHLKKQKVKNHWGQRLSQYGYFKVLQLLLGRRESWTYWEELAGLYRARAVLRYAPLFPLCVVTCGNHKTHSAKLNKGRAGGHTIIAKHLPPALLHTGGKRERRKKSEEHILQFEERASRTLYLDFT